MKSNRRSYLMCLAGLGVVVALSSPLRAWHHEGHALIARAAVRLLPDDVPAFVREGGVEVAHASLDPDQWRHALAPQLTATESPNHYYHYEMFEGRALPATRGEFEQFLTISRIAPGDAGFRPYAIIESTQRLMLAFAEYRRWPDNAIVRAKVLHYAGLLAHYSADLAQPLHCTIHFNGRAEGEKHRSPQSGIHGRIDGLLVSLTEKDLSLDGVEIETLHDLMPAIVDAIRESNRHVDRTYALEPKLPKRKTDALDAEVRAFAVERATVGAKLTASLILTAWRQSRHVELPVWLDRAALDEAGD